MRTLLFAALGAVSFSAIAAQPLLPADRGDQVPLRLVALPAPAGQFERAPVSFAWALDPGATLDAAQPHVAESREFWQTVDASELARGVEVTLTAPGAVILVSPTRGAAGIDASNLRLSSGSKGVQLDPGASAAELIGSGMPVAAGAATAKVADAGRGQYTLRTAGARGRYVVHVFEPASPVTLHARNTRSHVLGGETIVLEATMENSGRAIAAQAEALLVAPDGSSRAVPVTAKRDGTLAVQVTVPVGRAQPSGLWELQVFASGDGVQRDARTAFAVAQPTARFKGDYGFNAQRLRVALPVEAASPGRYEARGTLHATGPDRVLRPVSQAHAAAWVEAGDGMLVLDFSRAHLPARYGAPFEVRQLELHDQTRMAPLEVRARGARF